MITDEFLAEKHAPERCFEITQIPYLKACSGSLDKVVFKNAKVLLLLLYDEIYVKENSTTTFEKLSSLLEMKSNSLLFAIYTLSVEQYIELIEKGSTNLVLELTHFGVLRAELTNKIFK